MIWLITLGYLICGIVTVSLVLRFDSSNDDEIVIFFLVLLWPVVDVIAILIVVGIGISGITRMLANVGKHADR